MTTKKGTKRALLLSLLSLITCVTMLVGSTFAWFTDSVTSAGNIIKSGTLKVEMEWKEATDATAVYADASEGPIFNNEKWEPGYVEAKNVKISNVGSLALQYNLNIAAEGEVSELADVIDVYFADGEYLLEERADLSELTLVGTLSDILDGMPANMTGDLEAEDSATVTIALMMQEDAGNAYQDLAIGSEFSVVLMATQDNVEFDSFDQDYDDIVIPEMDVKIIDGNTYHYYNDGEVALVNVPYGNEGETFTVNDDVTVFGIGVDKNDSNGPVISKYSTTLKTLVLNEGLEKIGARAVNAKSLTSVNFPSTLKSIGEQAFRQTAMTELVIPANVEVIEEGAFRDMPNLTTVTIEGNTKLDNYVFRSCSNLTSIYLLGDDVTFEGGGQFATHQDTGYSNPLVIYVKNATVAARVYAAQSSATDYEVKILGAAADGSDASEVAQVKNDTELDTALADGAETVVLGNGTYIIPDSAQGKELTIVGNGSTVIAAQDDGAAEGDCDYSFDGSSVTFNNVTIKTTGTNYPGYVRMNGTYNNCTIQGTYTVYRDSEFNNCTFDTNNGYVWATWGASNVAFNNCTFNSDVAKAILLHGSVSANVTIKDCTFIGKTAAYTWDGLYVAAVSMDPVDGATYNVNFEGNNTVVAADGATADTYGNTAYAGLHQVKYANESSQITVTVNNTPVENIIAVKTK